MKEENRNLILAMMVHDQGDPKRIQHFLKVFTFASLIGAEEGLAETAQQTLETAAIVHDIGIHQAEALYGSSDGKYQEQLGPAEAEAMLRALGYPEAVIARVSYLVGHHHTYTNPDGPDYQILVEADFLVNLFEDQVPEAGQRAAYTRIFRTESGKRLFRLLFPAAEEEPA